MRLRYLIAFALASGLVGCQTTASVSEAELRKGDGEAAVIMSIQGVSMVPLTLDLIAYDDASGDDEGRVKLKRQGADLNLNRTEDGYAFTPIKPGKYLVARLVQQDFWFGCFQDDTFAIEVKPDTILYLGHYDMSKNVQQLRDATVKKGATRINMTQPISLFEGMTAPDIRPAKSGDIATVQAYLDANATAMDLPVEMADLKPIAFRPGRNVFGKQQCAVGTG